MPEMPVIDAHLHLWDPAFIRYPWLDSDPLLNRPRLMPDYEAATTSANLEAMVFVQCEADPRQFEQEAAWVAEQAIAHPRIKALVAWAPLERGMAVHEDLERLSRYPILRGIRRIIQFEPDLDFCLRPEFIDGVRTLADFGLTFDICIDYRHMANILKFAERVGDLPMVLDHIGKPAIAAGVVQPWTDQIRALAEFPNICCKVSGVATEANHKAWTAEQLKPYIHTAIDAFGFDRVMFGGDWPVSTHAITYAGWIDILDHVLAGESVGDKDKFWRGNAAAFYRI